MNNYTWYADNLAPSDSPTRIKPIEDQTSSIKAPVTTEKPYVIYNSTTGCQALLKKGIRKIFFHGDSFVRHMYAGMFLLLSGMNGTLFLKVCNKF